MKLYRLHSSTSSLLHFFLSSSLPHAYGTHNSQQIFVCCYSDSESDSDKCQQTAIRCVKYTKWWPIMGKHSSRSIADAKESQARSFQRYIFHLGNSPATRWWWKSHFDSDSLRYSMTVINKQYRGVVYHIQTNKIHNFSFPLTSA